jgi:transcriptional regulator with XRE-family HTH domain
MNNPDRGSPSQAVGRRIAAARRAAGLTQAELAARLDWPRDTLIHFEHGRRAISVDRLTAIAAALDIAPAMLLVDDPAAFELAMQITADPALLRQVRFFLTTLDDAAGDSPGIPD